MAPTGRIDAHPKIEDRGAARRAVVPRQNFEPSRIMQLKSGFSRLGFDRRGTHNTPGSSLRAISFGLGLHFDERQGNSPRFT